MAALAFPGKPETFPLQRLHRETKSSAFCPQAPVPPAKFISVSRKAKVPVSWQEVGARGFLCHALHMAPKGYSHTDQRSLLLLRIRMCGMRNQLFDGAHVTGKEHQGLVWNTLIN